MEYNAPYTSLIYLLNNGTLYTNHPTPSSRNVMGLSREVYPDHQNTLKKGKGSGDNPDLVLLAMRKLRISVPSLNNEVKREQISSRQIINTSPELRPLCILIHVCTSIFPKRYCTLSIRQ